MSREDTQLREAVERIAASVDPPPVPSGLQAGMPAGRRRTVALGIGAAAILLALAGGYLLFGPRPPVVVEYLRFEGRPVAAPGIRIVPLPEAGAVLVRVAEKVGWNGAGFHLAGVGLPALAAFPEAGGGEGLPLYHVRLFRARGDAGHPGAALFQPRREGSWVPISEREAWGGPGQLRLLQEILEARAIESVPGVVIAGRPGTEEPFRFETALGESLLEISFRGAPMWRGLHRVRLEVRLAGGDELLAGQLLISGRRTTILIAPLPGVDGELLAAVTPLFGDLPAAGPGPEIRSAGIDGVTNPKRIRIVAPVYPERARRAGLGGDVLLQAVIRKSGAVDGIVIRKMPEGGEWLAGSVVDAVSRWEYEPALLDGEPVDAIFTIIVKFYLEE